jgi:hypothetical protein
VDPEDEEEGHDPRRAAFLAQLARYELHSQDSRLAFVIAALMGAEQIASGLDAGLGKAIGLVIIRAIQHRNGVRQQIRETAAEASPASGRRRRVTHA